MAVPAAISTWTQKGRAREDVPYPQRRGNAIKSIAVDAVTMRLALEVMTFCGVRLHALYLADGAGDWMNVGA